MNLVALEEQKKLLGEFVEEQLGEECSVCVWQDGSVMVETKVSYVRSGRGFGFDDLKDLVDRIGDHKV